MHDDDSNITTPPANDGVLTLLVRPAAKVVVVGGTLGFYGAVYAVPHHTVDHDRFALQRHDELAESAVTHPDMLSLVSNTARASGTSTAGAVESPDTLDFRLTVSNK